VNKELAKYIFQAQHWYRTTTRFGETKIKKMIVEKFFSSGENKKYPEGAFKETWEELHKMGLVGVK
jgi:hypothetical protein